MDGSFVLFAVDSVRLMRELRAVLLAMAVCMGSVVRRDTGVASFLKEPLALNIFDVRAILAVQVKTEGCQAISQIH
jgi:hypothetical protein